MKTEALDGFINEITNGLVAAKDFAAGQLPDLAKQAVLYAGISNVVGVFMFGFVGWLAWRGHKWVSAKMEKENDRYSTRDMNYIWIATLGALGFLGAAYSLDTAIKATFAPKLYLVEYAAGLVKGRCEK